MRIFQGDLHLRLGILTAIGTCPPSPSSLLRLGLTPHASKKCFKEITKAASAKNAAEIVELNVGRPPPWRRRKLCAVLPVRTELIVALAFRRIREDFVRFVKLF